MVIPGHVQNGVVVLDGELTLPEGAAVVISLLQGSTTMQPVPKNRIQVPLVHTGEPGSVNLTSQRISEILDEEDAAPRH
jgi:hypothetical protein